jgi:hypothetical protein
MAREAADGARQLQPCTICRSLTAIRHEINDIGGTEPPPPARRGWLTAIFFGTHELPQEHLILILYKLLSLHARDSRFSYPSIYRLPFILPIIFIKRERQEEAEKERGRKRE